jgi:hypothetical protein
MGKDDWIVKILFKYRGEDFLGLGLVDAIILPLTHSQREKY